MTPRSGDPDQWRLPWACRPPRSRSASEGISDLVCVMCRRVPGDLQLILAQSSPFAPLPGGAALAAEYQRLQIYDYGRLRLHPAFALPYGFDPQYTAFPPFVTRFDPRARFAAEEPKPQHSYIGLIAMAILSIPEKKMVLSDIYQYILDQYPYFRNRGPGWRNSIRHNLSLNDCFIKAGRSANGKGHYWAIHPANVEDFKKGDFRRRKAQRKVRKHMGLSVPDDDDSPTPTPPPPQQPPQVTVPPQPPQLVLCSKPHQRQKRQFDVESLLAPDPSPPESPRPGSESPKGTSLRRPIQWTVSLPVHQQHQRFSSFATPCWASAHQAASLLSYSMGAGTMRPADPMIHRWQREGLEIPDPGKPEEQ